MAATEEIYQKYFGRINETAAGNERFLERSSLPVCLQRPISHQSVFWKTTSDSGFATGERKLYSTDETYLEENSFMMPQNVESKARENNFSVRLHDSW